MNDNLVISGRSFSSRLFLGTGKFSSVNEMKQAVSASGTEMVTVALRRVDFHNPQDPLIYNLDRKKILLLPNTSGAKNALEAVRLAKIAREMGCGSWIKLELTPHPRHLLPDPVETLQAAEILIKDGFTVLPYINADPVLAKKLEDAGAAAVMPLGSPIGTARGLRTRDMLEIIIGDSNVPVIIDAGIGTPAQACEAMIMGADAVLVNTAVSASANPVLMAEAFKIAVVSGRMAYNAGIAGASGAARASSPLEGMIFD
ncbi:MAG: thiazole synthase [Spirochaetes bacterium GWF1_41_5]|nr:MAG: thiazole synthase [Spirochaetes bacterium GWF1_41_5]HBE03747.1 thiazole synthase [Spirochaetia bacterium]